MNETDQSKLLPQIKDIIVLNLKKYETSGKAQLSYYVEYLGNEYSIDIFKSIMMDLSNQVKDLDVFDIHPKPTVVSIMVYSSHLAYTIDESNHISFFTVGPSNDPILSYDEIKTLTDLENKVDNDETRAFFKNKELVESKGITLAELWKEVKQSELDAIHTADIEYPNFGNDHQNMSEKLMEEGIIALSEKYGLTPEEIETANMITRFSLK